MPRRRYEITDEQVERIEDVLPEVNGTERSALPGPPTQTYPESLLSGLP